MPKTQNFQQKKLSNSMNIILNKNIIYYYTERGKMMSGISDLVFNKQKILRTNLVCFITN